MQPRPDRRRRHQHDPTTPITVNIPVSLKERLDAVVVNRRATRSGLICTAVREWLAAQEKK
jgi:metal-responsive CopG/Arc/MetJ family transcriptional regulator